jgi:hypothetical protein
VFVFQEAGPLKFSANVTQDVKTARKVNLVIYERAEQFGEVLANYTCKAGNMV